MESNRKPAEADEAPRAKTLGPSDRQDIPDLLPARMLKKALFCERSAYLEWAQAEFAENAFTAEGRFAHRRADQPGGSLPEPTASAPGDAQSEAPAEEGARPYRARALWLSSSRLGLTAKMDVVEGNAAREVVPVEYKRGSVPDVPEGAYVGERVQACAQALLLREHGYSCSEAAVYYAESRRRVAVPIDEALIERTLATAARLRELVVLPQPPPPLCDSPKCEGCSLVGLCLPDETRLLQEGLSDDAVSGTARAPRAREAGEEDSAEPAVELRRLHPARDDRVPLHVQAQGGRIGLSGECLVVQVKGEAKTEVRIPNTSQVCIFGNVQISTQALKALMDRGIPVSFFSTGGWFVGRAAGSESRNADLRLAQYRCAVDDGRSLALARSFVAAKIRNSRTLLRRNHEEAPPVVLGELDSLARKAEMAEATESLLGIEGTAARTYFSSLSGMIRAPDDVKASFDWQGRNRRPPRDPINALLSFAYALLAKDFAVTIASVGLDPLVGFYHRPRFGRPALALDLMEEFRPIVADSVVLGAINNGIVGANDFIRAPGSVALKPIARRRFLQAYERRMDQLVTHPTFGYRISYRRVLEVQARLLGRMLLGEIDDYPAFRTR